MARPVFHERTNTMLLRTAQHMPHALGITGRSGVGLITAATYLSEQAKAETIFIYPEKKEVVDRAEGTITIDIVRRLYGLTRGKSTCRRCIVVVAADTMSHEAQNAFLKLLEEPTDNTTFILLIHQTSLLLPTVLSRLQLQSIQPIAPEQSQALLDRLGVTDATRRAQLLFIASGLPARLTQLVADDALFESEASLLRQARVFIQGSVYERLLVAQALKGSRKNAQKLLEYAAAIIQFDITTKNMAPDASVRLLEQFEAALRLLNANGNIRLVLANVALSGSRVV